MAEDIFGIVADEVSVLSVTVRYSVSLPQLVRTGGGPLSFLSNGWQSKATWTWIPSNAKTKTE